MDFSELIVDLKKRIKVPNAGDINVRINKMQNDGHKDYKKTNNTGANPQLNPANKTGGMNNTQQRMLEGQEGTYAN